MQQLVSKVYVERIIQNLTTIISKLKVGINIFKKLVPTVSELTRSKKFLMKICSKNLYELHFKCVRTVDI
jgi:hypothetical protein